MMLVAVTLAWMATGEEQSEFQQSCLKEFQKFRQSFKVILLVKSHYEPKLIIKLKIFGQKETLQKKETRGNFMNCYLRLVPYCTVHHALSENIH